MLSNSIKNIPGDRADALQERLLLPITKFSIGAQLISPMMDTITLLTYSLHGDEEAGEVKPLFIIYALILCECGRRILSSHLILFSIFEFVKISLIVLIKYINL